MAPRLLSWRNAPSELRASRSLRWCFSSAGLPRRLHFALECRRGVIVVGDAASGKTSVIETLGRASRSLALASAPTTASASSTSVIFPGAMTLQRLFGGYTGDREWIDGVVNVAVRALDHTALLPTWLRLDGPADPVWMEQLNTVRAMRALAIAFARTLTHCSCCLRRPRSVAPRRWRLFRCRSKRAL